MTFSRVQSPCSEDDLMALGARGCLLAPASSAPSASERERPRRWPARFQQTSPNRDGFITRLRCFGGRGRAGAGGAGGGGRGGLLQLEAVLSVYVHMQTFMRKHVQVCLYTGVRKGMHVLRIFDTHIHAYMRICVHKHFFLSNTYKRRPR